MYLTTLYYVEVCIGGESENVLSAIK